MTEEIETKETFGENPVPITKSALTLESRTHKPPRIIIYRPQGLGKSAFGVSKETSIYSNRKRPG